MFFHPARVAPEKAVFRPALPTCFSPGIAEMQMAKSYFEKLNREFIKANAPVEGADA